MTTSRCDTAFNRLSDGIVTAAGMRTVGVLTGFDDYESLSLENPDAIINSVLNLGEVIATSSSATAGK